MAELCGCGTRKVVLPAVDVDAIAARLITLDRIVWHGRDQLLQLTELVVVLQVLL
jgi:hypothetical protein